MKLTAFTYYDDKSQEHIAHAPDINSSIAYGDSKEEALEVLIDIIEVSLEDEDLPSVHTKEYFSKDILKELDIPLDACVYILEVEEEAEQSYSITIA